MADIYKSVHENQLRNRLQILHVIDVDSANISKAFATDIKKAKDSAKEEKIRKVMKEFKEGTLKSSSGELVTDRKQAIAIAISEAENIEKSDDADSDNSEESIEKAQKANIGDIHIWDGKRYKKIANGKWVEVSESHGMSSKEHGIMAQDLKERSDKTTNRGISTKESIKYNDEANSHANIAGKLSDKEYTDEELDGKVKVSLPDFSNMTEGELNEYSMHPEKAGSMLARIEQNKRNKENGLEVRWEKDKIDSNQLKQEKEHFGISDIKKSVFDEIQENIEKSLNSISTKVSEEILNDIEKSVNHKYFKREGTPGNYKYYYTEEEYMKENNV